MLKTLTIRNVVLIERLELTLQGGFSALTGETGAGKSILLDALGLALGERSNAGFIRPGADQASVSAAFEVMPSHPVFALLHEQGIECEDALVLRRVLNADGKSRAFINDQPVSTALLRQVGGLLIEIHGQFDQLLQAATHRLTLDRFAGAENVKASVAEAFQAYKDAQRQLEEAMAAAGRDADQRAYLSHAIEELRQLAPQPDEEGDLLRRRDYLAHRRKVLEAVQGAVQMLEGDRGAESLVAQAAKKIQRVVELAGDQLGEAMTRLDHAMDSLAEASDALRGFLSRDQEGEEHLESIEERLYALRHLARKHHVNTTELPDLLLRLEADLHKIDHADDFIRDQQKRTQEAKATYLTQATLLTQLRQSAAERLAKDVMVELAPLKLELARFRAVLTPVDSHAWSAEGVEHVEFEVQTNPGLPFGGIGKIASGGELSRLMLALKVVISQSQGRALVVFDEIDSGVGGAVASAIGERLSRLGEGVQVLAITHSPQVAACAGCQMIVRKDNRTDHTTTEVRILEETERLEEIARMLAGEVVTQEARAAALQLLQAKTKAA
ncbi:MAG: DNA repair protein RecN [Holosporales bacterium]